MTGDMRRSAAGLAIVVIIAISAAAVTGCVSPNASPYASANEARDIVIGLAWHPEARGTPGERTIEWSIAPPAPAQAVAALVALREAIDREPLTEKSVLTNNDGRAVALFHVNEWRSDEDPVPAPGVVVWPEWRRADATLRFADMGKAEFLSNHHVRLSHRPRGEAGVDAIVDLRSPDARFVFRHTRLQTLRIADSGRWVAIDRDGVFRHGRLDPLDPVRSVAGELVPGDGAVVNALWLDGDQMLVVERDGPRIQVLDASEWRVLSEVKATFGQDHFAPDAVDARSFSARQLGSGTMLFTVDANGGLSARRLQLTDDDEHILSVAPSGRLVVTQDNFVKFQGAGARQIRELESSAVGERIPRATPMPNLDLGAFAGWLAWP